MATPLTKKLAQFSKVLTVAILTLAAATFAIGLTRGQDAVETFTAAIPEGLPVAVTITMAIGVARMARRRAVIRRLPAVETLGGTTVICSDKTGTLTENQMTVRALWTPDGHVDVSGSGYAPEDALHDSDGTMASPAGSQALHWCLLAGATCNDAALTHEVERVVELCGAQMGADGNVEPLDRDTVLSVVEHMAGRGLRVLATAVRPVVAPGEFSEQALPGTMVADRVAGHARPAPRRRGGGVPHRRHRGSR